MPAARFPHGHGSLECPSAPATTGSGRDTTNVMMQRNLVTGATGLLGSHIVEQLVARGEPVRAPVGPSGAPGFLGGLGVEVVEGHLDQPATLPAPIPGLD